MEVQEVAQIRIQTTLTSGSDLNSLKGVASTVFPGLLPHLDVSQVKAAFEKGKVLCLLLRLPPYRHPVLQMEVSDLRKSLRGIESLTDWLHRNTRSRLLTSFPLRPCLMNCLWSPGFCHAVEIYQLCDFRACLSERLDATDHRTGKQKHSPTPRNFSSGAPQNRRRSPQIAGEILPVTSCVLRYQAFPCFISSSPDSLQRELWKTTFL